MRELRELETHHQDFASRRLRIIVVSDDDQTTAKKTQADFPHLVVVADHDRNLAKAMEVIHAGANPSTGGDTNAPTTFFIDGRGEVRWLFRPKKFIIRLSPGQLLDAVDATHPPLTNVF